MNTQNNGADQAAVQQERVARHLSDLVSQAESEAREEREQERVERRAQHQELMTALRDLTGAVKSLSTGNDLIGSAMQTLHSEVKTLRAAILLAHSIGREEGGSSPLGLDVAKGDPFQISQPFAISSSHASMPSAIPAKKTRNLSPEARARISEAQKARWAARRAAQS